MAHGLTSRPAAPITYAPASIRRRGSFVDHLIALIQQYGLTFVFLNVLALQAGLPLPAYPTLIVAGALAAAGGTPAYQLIGVGVAGALLADTGWYVAGRTFGMRILSTLCRVSLSQ